MSTARVTLLSCAWILLAGGMLSGCVFAALAVGATAAVGTVAYVKGELRTEEEVPLDRTWEATLAALEKLELHVAEKSKDGLQGRAAASGADATTYTVCLDKVGETRTRIGIRVGTFGDKAKSELLLAEIRAGLPRGR